MPHIHRVNRAEKSPRKNEWEAGTEGSSAGRRIHAGLAARDRHGRGHRVLLGRGGCRGPGSDANRKKKSRHSIKVRQNSSKIENLKKYFKKFQDFSANFRKI